jgi:hypothetical protein
LKAFLTKLLIKVALYFCEKMVLFYLLITEDAIYFKIFSFNHLGQKKFNRKGRKVFRKGRKERFVEK